MLTALPNSTSTCQYQMSVWWNPLRLQANISGTHLSKAVSPSAIDNPPAQQRWRLTRVLLPWLCLGEAFWSDLLSQMLEEETSKHHSGL